MSLDLRDVLNLPQEDASGTGSASGRPSKKQKTATTAALAAGGRANLKGLAREVQSLGGANPIAIVPPLLSTFKKRRAVSRKAATHWELQPFTNSARADGKLVLRHWRRKVASGAAAVDAAGESTGSTPAVPDVPIPDSAFSKFNVQVVVPQYNDDQYQANLQSADWTREETDYLLQLVRDYDLRWPLIWDRYDYGTTSTEAGASDDAAVKTEASSRSTALVQAPAGPRTMEDLKARYYEIAAKMMAVQKPAQYMTQAEYSLHGLMANFKPQQETARKAFVHNALMRSRDEVREEEALLFEVRRIMARVERTNEERRELYNRLDFPHADTDISSFKTSQGLHQLLQSLMYQNEKSKKRKSLAAGDGVSPSVATGAAGAGSGGSGAANGTTGAPEAGGRRDSIAASGAGHHRRESSTAHAESSAAAAAAAATAAGQSTSGKKKGAAQTERRKLTEQEREVYGVTYHDRLGSGPTFRYEKINKLFTHKSGQQQLRITNILNELDMPARLFMPTAAVTGQFEQLVNAVVQLVDLRKVSDKLDGELKVEEQRKAERDKARGVVAEASEAGEADKAQPGDGETDKAVSAAPAAPAAPAAAGADAGAAAEADEATGVTEATEDAAAAAAAVKAEDAAAEAKNAQSAAADGDRRAPSRPGSSSNAAHKRSASVLSAASDKSAKRQKK